MFSVCLFTGGGSDLGLDRDPPRPGTRPPPPTDLRLDRVSPGPGTRGPPRPEPGIRGPPTGPETGKGPPPPPTGTVRTVHLWRSRWRSFLFKVFVCLYLLKN